MTTKTKTKPYIEVLDSVLYTRDYTTTTTTGNTIPTNRLKVSLVNYSGEVEVKGEVREYQGQKIVITNSKLQSQDGQNVIKQKSLKTSYGEKIVNDETIVKMSIDEFDDLLKHFKDKTNPSKKSNKDNFDDINI